MKVINEYRQIKGTENIEHIKEWRLNRWYEKVAYVYGAICIILAILAFFVGFIVGMANTGA